MNFTKPISVKNCQKTVFFRCDASLEIGTGHVMRCLTLAHELKRSGWQCGFITIDDSLTMSPDLKNSNFDIYPENYIPQSADLLVVDSYVLDKVYEIECQKWAKKIMVIDDLANRNHDCEILLDQTFGRSVDDYRTYVSGRCNILCGAEYILLRSQFFGLREKAEGKRKKIKRAENILINFGSTNPCNAAQIFLDSLADFQDWSLNIDVVLGGQAEGLKDIEKKSCEMSKNTPHIVNILTDVHDMASYMLKADMAFGAGGTTSWERACLGLPTVLVVASADQALVARNMDAAGAVTSLGKIDDITIAEIDKAFEKMRDNGTLLRKMSEQSFDVCDGRGVLRVVKFIEELF